MQVPLTANKPFVVVKDGQLMLEDGPPFRFASLNAPDLFLNDDFEIEDTMRTLTGFGRRVTRTYTLQIEGTCQYLSQPGHIAGWDSQKGDWIYNEARWQQIDRVIALAEKRRQTNPPEYWTFGTKEQNWAGNWVDIIIHRKNPEWDYDTARAKVDFFTDRECIDATKLIYTHFLNRINTITGKRYGDDPTILAWETGNELQHSFIGKLPAPGAWTVEMAKHIRSLAPRTLIMDGSFAKADTVPASYAMEVLECPEVDLMSYHYYYSANAERVSEDADYLRKHGKVFIAGEYGFFDTIEEYAKFMATCEKKGVAGSMVWSLRSHSSQGGFRTHYEDDINYAYHAPGWPSEKTPPTFSKAARFDEKEHSMVQLIRDSSYIINGESVPSSYPIPNAPFVWLKSKDAISWSGSSWADMYEVWLGQPKDGSAIDWHLISQSAMDAVAEGNAEFKFERSLEAGNIVRMRGIGPNGEVGGWSNILEL